MIHALINGNRSSFLAKVCYCLLALAEAHCANANDVTCLSVPSIKKQGYSELVISSSGRYCLDNDVHIASTSALDSFLSGGHGRSRPVDAIDIRGSDVILDLQKNRIETGDQTNGIQIRAISPESDRITIRNGVIRSSTQMGISSSHASAVVMEDFGDPLQKVSKFSLKTQADVDQSREFMIGIQRSVLKTMNGSRPQNPSNYAKRDIHLENLRIYAHGGEDFETASNGAVNIFGAGTIIRDCVIETDAGTAIWIFGPNALIENNTIIVHGTNQQREPDAPIRLIDADGTIIRNNKIVIKGDAHHRAISTFDTGTFVVDNNTFYGLTKEDELARAFTGELKMQESNSHFEPAFKGLFLSD